MMGSRVQEEEGPSQLSISEIEKSLDQISEIEGRVGRHKARGTDGSMEEENRPGKQEVESTARPPAARADQGMCGFLTDVEGNYDYFERYVEISLVLQWSDASRTKLELVPGAEFVYGGDSQDKGIGDIRFVRVLLDLKKRYPDRVHIIIGNRDANKLRLATELSEEAIRDEGVMTDTSFPYWVPADKRVTPAKFLEKGGEGGQPLENTAANRLRWMLKDTMGADGAFERRRTELKILSGDGTEISDEDVVASYRKEVDTTAGEEAFVLEYLRQGQLAYVYGKTLFVHGGVTEANMGTVPGKAGKYDNVREWVSELNAWGAAEVQAYEKGPAPGVKLNSKERAGHGLMDYGVPDGNDGKSVIMATYLKNGNAEQVPRSVEKYLSKSGVSSLLVGHIPHGETPTVMKGQKAMVVMADTSYSKMGHESWWGVDNRGEAVSEVVVSPDGSVQVHGFLGDGRQIEYKVAAPGEPESPECDPFVGRQMDDRWWVRAKLKEGGGGEGGAAVQEEEAQYILCLGVGFKVEYAELGLRGVKQQLNEATTVCSFFTDVQGDWSYFESLVAISKVLSWTSDAHTKLELAEDTEVVFGGNATDKGIGDIRFLAVLLELKERYPDRVHLLAGDRDIQKLRMTAELDPRALADPKTATDEGFPYWFPPQLRVTPNKYLEFLGGEGGKPLENNAVNRLKWVLGTMGAPEGADDRRRMELKLLRGTDVSDEEVVESYCNAVNPAAGDDATMFEYLKQGQIGYVFGKTLFLHGGITEANMGAVPAKDQRCEDVREWVRALNAWMESEIKEVEEEEGKEIDKTKRAGRRLIDYAVPGGFGGRSAIAASHLYAGTTPVTEAIEGFLVDSGVSSVFTGHVPHGDCPAVIRRKHVFVASCDTSQSAPGHACEWGRDDRGDAVCEVLVHRDGSAEVHGRLADGREVLYHLADLSRKGGAGAESGKYDAFIGRQLADTSWVKAKVNPTSASDPNDPDYLLCFATIKGNPPVPCLDTRYVKQSFLANVKPYKPPEPIPTQLSPVPMSPPQAQGTISGALTTPMRLPASPNAMEHNTPGASSTASNWTNPGEGEVQPAVKVDCAPWCSCFGGSGSQQRRVSVNTRQEAGGKAEV